VDAFIESGAENVFADKVFSKADQVPCPELHDVKKDEEVTRLALARLRSQRIRMCKRSMRSY
jgi:hypothetical protein